MSEGNSKQENKGYRISLDAWAVGLSLLLTVLVRFGVLKHISW
jgi:hypothetical protein